MTTTRRDFIAVAAAASVTSPLSVAATPAAAAGGAMYGLVGQMKAVPGQRDALIAILLEGVNGMPGCLSYIVAHDPGNPDALWITEAWDSKASHKASLGLPSVRQAITRGKPLIAGFGERFETTPVGGPGLAIPGKTS